MNATDRVVAIVVTYNPEINVLVRLLNTIEGQVDSVVVVDNSPGKEMRRLLEYRRKSGEFLITSDSNIGVAAAHNVGIEWARRNGKTHVVLFDQDSIPGRDMISHLLFAMRKLNAQGNKVAAVGPAYQDLRNVGRPCFTKVNGLCVDNIHCRSLDEIVESDILISSGSLISLQTLEKVGGPLNKLFIDQIDMEWCFRARALGYSLFGCCNAILHHSLGEEPKDFFGRKFIHQNPLRHYYIFRNAVWLLFKKYVPIGWKFLFIRMIIARFFIYSLFVSPRLSYLKMMALGMLHGLSEKLGKFEPKGN